MSALDRSIADLCERHNLLSASVIYLRGSSRNWFSANVQWADASLESGRAIAGEDGDTFSEALNAAVGKMLTMRGGGVEMPTDALELAA